MAIPPCEWMVLDMPMFGASGDPCAALFGSLKQDCENARNGANSAVNGATGAAGSIWDFLTQKQTLQGGVRHVFVRVAEVIIGGVLIIVGINTLIKAQTGTDVVGKVGKTVKGIVP